ncbi:MAG TPA: acylneuraminate cytidylyltransferase [Chloroflexi bacterium]|nr:acylneuraminate cytidylyltransferase [Chloroflexota bacterium]
MTLKTIAIIQARMSASRLPGKVLLDIGGKPMLEWVVERTRRAQFVNEVVVATTLDPSDTPVFEFCKRKDYRVGRGSVHDVLDRYYQTAKHFHANVVVRITADCPLIDPALIDEAVRLLLSGTGALDLRKKLSATRFDFIANRLPPPWGRTFPIGLDVEVMTFEALERAWRTAIPKNQREHVTPFLYEGTPVDQLKYSIPNTPYSSAMTPDGQHIALLHHTPDYGDLRWTVDTPEDLELVRKIVSYFPDDTFTWKDVLALVQAHPELTAINAQIQHKTHLDVDERGD